jgi:hypothetical protein
MIMADDATREDLWQRLAEESPHIRNLDDDFRAAYARAREQWCEHYEEIVLESRQPLQSS